MWTRAIIYFLILILVRFLVASHPFSGYDSPPLYGDYEAQRHWMEITINIPIADWYRNTTDNDLLYWGLDYPPLSAYFSFICGKILQIFEPEAVELYTSRGYITPSSKLFMRTSVVLSDIFIYFPAVIFFVFTFYNEVEYRKKLDIIFVILLQPPLILIDHGHFQYNSVTLGLVTFAITFAIKGKFIISSILYVLAFNYKIMALYYSPAFFVYFLAVILRKNLKAYQKLLEMLKLLVVSIFTIFICWLPFVVNGTVTNVLHRCFPIGRGVYEDKVANLWCSVSPLLKLRLFPANTALLLCTGLTLIGLLPSCYIATRKCTKQSFLLCLFCVSFSYFFFSYHVHEKTVLFPLLPAILLHFNHPRLASWTVSFAVVRFSSIVSIISFPANTFFNQSLLPLLHRDGHTLSLLGTCIFMMISSERNILANTQPVVPVLIFFGSQSPLSLPDFLNYTLSLICFALFFASYIFAHRFIYKSNSK